MTLRPTQGALVVAQVAALLVALPASSWAQAAKPEGSKPSAAAAQPGAAPAAPRPAAPPDDDDIEGVSDAVFEEGLELFKAEDFETAAERFWHYISGNEAGADHYEWAEFYMARSFLALGLDHAAVEYFYNVSKERKRPELLPDALRNLERIMTTLPHDRDLLQRDLLGGREFGALPADVRAFVAYNQGRLDLLAGRDKWAERHFEVLTRLQADNPLAKRYIERARFAGAIRDLRATHARDSKAKREKRDAARKVLEEVSAAEIEDFELKNEAKKVVARLYFEEEEFDKALEVYETIEVPFLSAEEATLFLEKAWTRYYARDYRGSLGILLSLDAPSYRRYFGPERFVLKALCYKALCHYAASKGAAREFLRRYGEALNELRRRRDPLAHPVVRRAAVQARAPKRELAFLDALQAQRQSSERFSDEFGMRTHLARVYDLKIAEVVRRLDNLVKEESIAVATDLLDYEEQARLVDYEVSLEVFKRVKEGKGKRVVEEQKAIPLGGQDIYYMFDGEYWNDELHNYRFRIEDRCFGEELFE
jgi:hypothetical protein